MFKTLRNYSSVLLLILGILTGAGLGMIFKERAAVLKPLGDIFLNLLFTAVVPLVFFSISSAIASKNDTRRLARIMGWMLFFFILTGVFAAVIMTTIVHIFPPFVGAPMSFPGGVAQQTQSTGAAIVSAFTVTDFSELLSKKHMLALIVFSLLVGYTASQCGEKAQPLVRFLAAGHEVMSRVIGVIMLYAPIGLGAYFAYIIGTFGPQLMGSYVRVVQIYYPTALLYFAIAFSIYVFWAGGRRGLKIFWGAIPQTALTALATGSSVATIPVNLAAAKKIGMPEDIREFVIPIGASMHLEGSCLAAIVKIAFLFGVFQMPFTGMEVWVTAGVIAVLCGTVISGIPSGGMLGELLIVTLYGFPIEALPLITMIGTIVDPPATMLNAVGDNVTGMLVTRKLQGPNWVP